MRALLTLFIGLLTIGQSFGSSGLDLNTFKISGTIQKAAGTPISGVDLVLTSFTSTDTIQFFDTTDSSGNYSFDNLDCTLNYFLEVERNASHLNGVSSLDMVLVQRHINGTGPFDSGYKIIAADVNKDKKVNIIDAIAIRLTILGITQGAFLTQKDSWTYIYQEPADLLNNPFEIFENSVTIAPSTEDITVDFVGVKLGDVNNSSVPN